MLAIWSAERRFPRLQLKYFPESKEVCTEITLQCPPHRHGLIVWNAKFKNGTHCFMSYATERNNLQRNCSNNMNWTTSPDRDTSLHIKPLYLFNEGVYKCTIAIDNGTYSNEYTLTILVPPQVSLTHNDSGGTAVCKAAAGKPAPQISWDPQGYSTIMNETLLNGTETFTSTYNITSAKGNTLTCFVFHQAGNKSLVLNLPSGSAEAKHFTVKILLSSLAGFLGILLLLLFIYHGRHLYARLRKVNISKGPETISRLSIQENELEPYATFVQMENVIYDRACDFPSGLSPST
ncbi:cell surface glycoprotein CD200 receptor 1 isoform X2 [Hemicordylus capensis]|uniref:cell surface glycoprotein CD200 receptor 1 isoform X2 n=1 Tax=Hemicordylus capensis TaxID=884348 RepID=UPI0023032B80|nr:cell surface glycoprotein CD200 receptor 1 isoform X2 [Hemicordylus capensis]